MLDMAAEVTPLTARAHVFVADLDRPQLARADQHHLARVLRLRTGAQVTACDGEGRWRPCQLDEGTELEACGGTVAEARPSPPITVAFALVKGERPELVVQKLTELGVDRIVPFAAGRSVARWDAAKTARQQARMVGIARQAAMQCRRTWLPEVGRLHSFDEMAALPGAALADLAGAAPSLEHATVLVGPEGGWTPEERSHDLPTVRIGAHVLRAETAAITISAVLTAMRSGLVARPKGLTT